MWEAGHQAKNGGADTKIANTRRKGNVRTFQMKANTFQVCAEFDDADVRRRDTGVVDSLAGAGGLVGQRSPPERLCARLSSLR